jgi:hypothetical protein
MVQDVKHFLPKEWKDYIVMKNYTNGYIFIFI